MTTRRDFINAIIFGKVKKVKKILKRSKLGKVDGKFSGVVIMLATRHNQPEITRMLINKSAKVNKRRTNNYLSTPLLYAAQSRNLELLKNLLKVGADVNAKSKNGCTALHFAASHGYIDMVKYLLRHGARTDINIEVKKGYRFTALHYACVFGGIECVKALVKHNSDGVNPKDKDSIHLIQLMVAFSYPRTTEFLLNYVDNVNIRYNDSIYKFTKDPFLHIFDSPNEGPTLLHWAIVKGDKFITKLLINNCADVNLKTFKSEMTPLMIAAQGSNLDIFSIILDQNPEINAVDSSGNSALHYVFYNKYSFRSRYASIDSPERNNEKTKVTLLDNSNADLNAKFSSKLVPNLTSALDLAIYFGCHDTVRYLLYNTDVGLQQIDYSKIELAAFDDYAISDSIIDEIDYIEYRRNEAKVLQCTLATYILNRHTIGLYTTEDTLTKVNALVSVMETENWYNGYCIKELKAMSESEMALKRMKIGESDISYWDIVTKDPEDLVKLAFNEAFSIDSANDVCRTYESIEGPLFYYYGALFPYKFNYAYTKSQALGKVIEIINCLFGAQLPYYCCEEIAGVMTNNDLKCLLLNFNLHDYAFLEF